MAGPRGCQVKAETQTKPPKHFGTDGIGQFRRERQALESGGATRTIKTSARGPRGRKESCSFHYFVQI